ncbi:hypothetical protein JZ751_023372 [Albula glossodonta]|uniref:PNPLA domain-containing protein n=1 Tax=Albula glossodonta TaxID=121402 RepID=A0A8T2NH43_9TELE|nr:hypothetical protein JZ751_023372 [Albula glossodonta]
MGLYLNTGLCLARQGGKVARLHRKLRYLCAILRTLPCLTKPLLTLSRQCCSHALLLPPLPRTPTTKALPKFSRSETGGFGRLPGEPHRNTHVGGVIRTPCSCLSAARACSSSSPRSTSSREAFRGEAPVGIWEESKSTLQLGYFGERLGESFHYLSRHINTYFKGPAMPLQTLHGRAELMGGERKPRGRAQRRALTQNPANERVQVECGESVRLAAQRGSVDQNEEPPPIQAAQGLQLFHISSLTTRFGESYSYVARHINSVFSTGLTQEVQPQSGTDRTRGRRRRRRTTSHVGGESKGSDLAKLTEVQGTEQDSGSVKTDDSKTWEESYRHFAHRINSYFGAKVTDMTQEPAAQERAWFSTGAKVSQSSDHSSPPDSDLRRDSPCPATNQDAGTLQPKSPGLFHISSLATSFGESYAQMANHINCYFKGVAGWEGEAEEGERVEPGDWQDMGDTTVPNQQGALSFIQSLLQPGTSISDLLGSSLWAGTREQMAPTTPTASPVEAVWSRQVVSRKEAEERTRVLVKRLQQAASPTSLSTCIEELNEHLILYPACKAAAWQEKTVLVLLGQRRFHRDNQELQDAIREALALIGYVDSVKGRGIRILSIDGGGTRGVVPLQLLKRLEVATGRQVHQLFDYICGVSTGSKLHSAGKMSAGEII